MGNFILLNLDQLLLLAVLLLISAVFSGCETALFSLKVRDLNRIRKSGHIVDSFILSLYGELPDFLLTILLGNMIVNILYFAVATRFVSAVNSFYGSVGSLVFGIISFCAVLLIGEIIPKSIASVLQLWFARIVITPVYYIHKLSTPLRVVLRSLLHFFERIVGLKRRVSTQSKELSALLELEYNRGTISKHEMDLLENVVVLPDIKVGEILTPRVDVFSVADNAEINDVLEVARASGHNKIPVRSTENDEYLAWVDARDLFFASTDSIGINDYLLDFFIISEYDRCDRILDKFVKEKYRMAQVMDERGATAGILVLSDVLSELFGVFGDEESRPEIWSHRITDNSYIFDGRISIRDWGGIFDIDADSQRSNTIGGLITDLLGRSAVVGDCVSFMGVELVVIETFKLRIRKVRATRIINDDPETGDHK